MRRLFIIRPEPSASATVREAASLGLDAVAMPLFRIEPIEWSAPEPSYFDALLLTSANTVRRGGKGLGRLRGLPVYAVGEATADAAREAGFTIAGSGDAGIDRLLRSIPSQLRLLHLCGEHRKQAGTGQAITPVPVYRSIELPIPSEFQRIAGQTVAVHSPRAAQRLSELATRAQIDRGSIRIAAISSAAAAAAGAGWDMREAADHPDSASLLALAARLCDNPAKI